MPRRVEKGGNKEQREKGKRRAGKEEE